MSSCSRQIRIMEGEGDAVHAAATLLSLPNELLSTIITLLPDTNALVLGCTCRTLNRVVLDHFFRRLPQENDYIGSFPVLQAYSLSLYPNIHQEQPGSVSLSFSLSRYLEEAAHLLRFIENRPSPLWSIRLYDVPHHVTFYTKLLPSLCKADCNRWHMSLRRSSPRHAQSSDDAPYEGPLLDQPKTVELQDMSLLLDPPFRRWWLSSMNRSEVLQELSLSSMPNLSEVIDDLHPPHLQTLWLSTCSVTPEQVTALLGRLPRLLRLTLYNTLLGSTPEDIVLPGDPFLPHLGHIDVPAHYLHALLRSPVALPSLQFLNLSDYNQAEVEGALLALAEAPHPDAYPEVSVVLPLWKLCEASDARVDVPRTAERRRIVEIKFGTPYEQEWAPNDVARLERVVRMLAMFDDLRGVVLDAVDWDMARKQRFGEVAKQACPNLVYMKSMFEKVNL